MLGRSSLLSCPAEYMPAPITKNTNKMMIEARLSENCVSRYISDISSEYYEYYVRADTTGRTATHYDFL